MNTVYLSLGSNLGNRLSNLQSALTALSRWLHIKRTSSVYVSTGFKMEDKQAPYFFNIACQAQCTLSEAALLQIINDVEANLGRKRTLKRPSTNLHLIKNRNSELSLSRLLDIDIVFFNRSLVNNTMLQIPHPEYQNRDFVLYPLAEVIAPRWTDPVKHKTISQIIEQFERRQDKSTNITNSFGHQFKLKETKQP